MPYVGVQFFRAVSHYGRRSRGRQFSLIRLQETKNLTSRLFILEAKVQRPFDQGDRLSKEVWVGTRMETQTMVEILLIFFHKRIKT
jgi:hypothetical protein